MNSIERVETVLQGGIPDRVPVDLHNFLMTASHQICLSGVLTKWCGDGGGSNPLWHEFGHDVLLLENGTTAWRKPAL